MLNIQIIGYSLAAALFSWYMLRWRRNPVSLDFPSYACVAVCCHSHAFLSCTRYRLLEGSSHQAFRISVACLPCFRGRILWSTATRRYESFRCTCTPIHPLYARLDLVTTTDPESLVSWAIVQSTHAVRMASRHHKPGRHRGSQEAP